MRCEHDSKCIYYFNCPGCIARFLTSLLNRSHQHYWWKRIQKIQGDELMEKVRGQLKGKTAK